jgi:apolipoprotein N-acyltransferase
LFERASLRTGVPIYRGPQTVYLRFGDWFARLCLLLSGISAIILMVRDVRERRKP